MASLKMMMALSLISLVTHPVLSQAPCKSMTFPNGKTFANCLDLPTSNAVLHWTYDAAKNTVSMAFTAPIPAKAGWVVWAINPTGTGMVGAQGIVAMTPKPTGGPMYLHTLNIQSYEVMTPDNISYNVTDMATEKVDDKITVYGTWALHNGETTVNTVWQVGPLVDARPAAHAMEPANLNSKLQINFAN